MNVFSVQIKVNELNLIFSWYINIKIREIRQKFMQIFKFLAHMCDDNDDDANE